MLLAHPELRDAEAAKVAAAIDRVGGGPDARAAWEELRSEPLVPDEDDGY